jgi:hypothetical protein
LFDKRNLPAAAPPFEFLLAAERVAHVAKMLNPKQAVRLIVFREALYFALSLLTQPTHDVIRNADV